jgi:aryl-alcohol dehydrogenase-like predicted oxidoreductase
VANDRRKDHPRFQGDNFARNRALAEHLDTLSKAKGCQSGQIALAWLLAQGDDIVPIPGTKQVGRIDENLGALDVRLSADELASLSQAFPPGAASGTRYPAGSMNGVYL